MYQKTPVINTVEISVVWGTMSQELWTKTWEMYVLAIWKAKCLFVIKCNTITLFSKSSEHKGKGLFLYSKSYSVVLYFYHYTRLHYINYCHNLELLIQLSYFFHYLLTILGLLDFHANFRIDLLNSAKEPDGILKEITFNL